MIKNYRVLVLLDTYGRFLPDFQRNCVEDYYSRDLSFSEISENTSKTRQGVRDAILRAEVFLYDMEKKLGLVEKVEILRENLLNFKSTAEKIKEEGIKEEFQNQIEKLEKVTESW